ncbi:MAG: cytochrome C oxidase subunit I [Gammaproteobacteria bacterium]|nr:cytochrome C oxidase subunit I [Gammaproteobacteria bacterium]
MPDADFYQLEIPSDYRRRQVIVWLWLAVSTLLVAGLFSVLLVLARTPFIGELFPLTDFFHTALVIHVNLSSLVWILAFASALWTLNSRPVSSVLGKVAFFVVLSGVLVMTISPFTGSANALMSNYIPVLDDRVFIGGLLLFAIGMGFQVLISMGIMLRVGRVISAEAVIRFGLNCAAVGVCLALLAFTWSYLTVPKQLAREIYYEVLFWGCGHILQFTYTLLMMVAWLWLASLARLSLPVSPRVALFLFAVGLFSIFLTPIIYLEYPVIDPSHRSLFTQLMSFGGSLAVFPLAVAILFALFNGQLHSIRTSVSWNALICSLFLFGVGGFMGFLIDGNNVKIPAHYHGCIVGVTLSLMGLCYQLIPALGYNKVKAIWAIFQLRIYAVGQFLHISGLLWSGGYGVERKVAGGEQWLNSVERITGMALMGLGGMLSALGGFLFIILIIKILTARDFDTSSNEGLRQWR